jgi:hypothetical protein
MFSGFKKVEIFFENGEHKYFDKYEVNVCAILRNSKSKKILGLHGSIGGYNRVSMYDNDGKSYMVSLARIVLSTFVGKPSTNQHTADHRRSHRKKDDRLLNLRWLDKSGQNKNRIHPSTNSNSMIIIHSGIELTTKEWSKKENVSDSAILGRARQGKEWTYKQYQDLKDERWLDVVGSKNSRGFWKVSNLGRAAYHSTFTRRVFDTKELVVGDNYPSIFVNGKHMYLHCCIFETFKPEEYKLMQKDECILHNDDNRLDCSINSLRIGSQSENRKDAYKNGRYNGCKSQYRKCVGYRNNERYEFKSLVDARDWLRINGHPRASSGHITESMENNLKIRYGFVWKDD